MRAISNITAVNNVNSNINKPTHNMNSNQFKEILENKIYSNNKIKFSKHASMRLNFRNIKFTDEQMKRLQEGVLKAQKKGIKDSLILMDEVALIVNISSGTVITAMDSNQREDIVFTNIDGAVII